MMASDENQTMAVGVDLVGGDWWMASIDPPTNDRGLGYLRHHHREEKVQNHSHSQGHICLESFLRFDTYGSDLTAAWPDQRSLSCFVSEL
jgi:hypothetical protein